MAGRGRKLRFIDAFAGCGGLSLGLAQAGLKGVFAIERDPGAFATFTENFLREGGSYRFDWPSWLPKAPIAIEQLLSDHSADLRALRGQVDVLAGGPPCQGFSSAGRRRSDDPRNQLFKAYLKLVDAIQPSVVLIENVRGFTVDFTRQDRSDNYSAKLVEALKDKYEVRDALLNLTMFGVPQNRVRYFVVAARKGIALGEPFQRLKEMLPTYLRALGIRAPVSSWAAISDLEVHRCGRAPSRDTPGFDEIRYMGPRTKYQRLMATDGGPADLRLARHTPEVEARFGEIIRLCHSEGRLNKSIGAEMRERFHLKKRALRVLDPDLPSPTITSMPDDLLHYREPRILTVRENARLQSFPDWFVFQGKYTTGGERRRVEVPRYTQVANAVPPLAARAFGVLLLEILSPSRSGHTQSRDEIVKELA